MESALVLGGICFLAIITLIIIGVPIGLALGLAAVTAFYLLKGNADAAPFVAFDFANNFILTAIPLFILMGEVLVRCGLSDMLYRGTSKWLAWAPGGLFHVNIGSCAMFAAISGSSPATAATIGTVAVPALGKRGYDARLTVGSLAAGGTLGILIPPSINLIVYGAITGASVARLFAGGMLPGIMLSSMFMIYIAVRVIKNPALAPRESFTFRALPSSFFDLWPIIVIMGLVLGGIFSGIFTPTEAAAIGATSAIMIALCRGKLTWRILIDALDGTVTVTSMVLVIVVGASIVASLLAFLGLPRQLATFVLEANLPNWAILALIYLLYIFLGCFMDGLSAMLMTLPAIIPLIGLLGFEVIWFGVILVILTEIGLLTPPVGANIFVIKAISGKSLQDVFIGSAPFFLIMMLALTIVTIFPEIITWLPTVMMD